MGKLKRVMKIATDERFPGGGGPGGPPYGPEPGDAPLAMGGPPS